MPNRAVDVNSWARLACYPRSTFYPLSDGPPTRGHRLTKADFRPCLRCPSCSQAPLCLCALRRVSMPAEGTIARLRYSLGGDRPSQTAHQAGSRARKSGPRLDFQRGQGGISRSAPPKLTLRPLGLPPILHGPAQKSPPSCSEGSRGLSVLLRVDGIFTAAPVSPSGALRQHPDRYAIRAGRNLPDKEFRYLRTVIVTAAVHRGFNHELRHKG